jgi:PAS domain S-box-containing protein
MKPIIRILMLEDSTEDAELLNRELLQGGMSFDVRRVDTRDAFLEQLMGFKPDIVISDYKLPSFGGMDALELLRKISSSVPFILVSGHIGETGAIEAFKMGVTDFVLKDSVGRLVPSVQRALREGEERTEYRRLEQRFRLLFDSAPSAMVMINALGQIEMINGQTERMFGFPRAELFGRSIETLLPERLRAHNRASGSSFFSTAQQLPMGAEPGLFGLKRDAIEFPIDIGLNPIETEDGVMALVVILDITVRRQAEREKEQHRRELERSNADLERFAYVASHDLRAPLHAIALLAEWVRDDIAAIASPEAVESLKLLQGRALRLQMLLDGLLAYARVGRVDSPIEDVDIAALVRDIADTLAPPPGFLIACVGTMPSLRTRRSPIHVVLQNLIANGLKHHDRAEGRLTVSAHLVDEVAEFRVSDDGPGIPPQFHDRVFEIFQTLQSRDEVDSGGIGLSIVKKEVENHGGRIWVESMPPKRGTTFIFTWRQLPR